jgi:phosphomannomutase
MIKFGTSGWRGIIGEDFTFANVRIASQGIANYLKKSGQKGSGVVVAYDTRFLSEKFAAEAAKILAFNGLQAYLCTRDVPTPAVSFETIRRKAMGAINFTASHNPPEYNGLKFSTSNGAPALPEVTRQIEREIHLVQEKHDRLDVYLRHLARLSRLLPARSRCRGQDHSQLPRSVLRRVFAGVQSEESR